MTAEGGKLRVGVLLDSFTVPAWVRKVLAEVQGSTVAEIVLVVENGRPPRRDGFLAALWKRRKHLLYEAYARLDRKLLKARPDAFARVDASDLLRGCPVLAVTPEQTRHSDTFRPEDLAAIRAHDLDVALRFGFRILRGEVLAIARHGVWSYHHDDNQAIRGGPPGFWEVMEDHAATGSVLQVLTEDLDGGRVIYRSWSPTHRRSVARNKNHVYWQSAAFVRRKLADLHREGPSALGDGCAASCRPYSHRLYRKPTNRQLLPLLLQFGWRAGKGALVDSVTRDQWFLAYRLGAEDGPPEELFRFTPILPPRDRFWADPFPVCENGRRFVFLEEYPYRTGKGHISVLEIDDQGGWTRPRRVLERPYHLSYPFVFRWQGEYFMVPESARNRTVEIYRCRSFPDQWSLEKVLLEGVRAVDATLHQEGDRWWMFVNIGSEEASHCHDELYLYHAPSPLGPWQPHPRNPVKSDARGARPAGRLFRCQGQLYRPAQDCSRRYGGAIVLNQVRRLDLAAYEEAEASRIVPGWRPGLLAAHTWNQAQGLAVVDGMRRVAG